MAYSAPTLGELGLSIARLPTAMPTGFRPPPNVRMPGSVQTGPNPFAAVRPAIKVVAQIAKPAAPPVGAVSGSGIANMTREQWTAYVRSQTAGLDPFARAAMESKLQKQAPLSVLHPTVIGSGSKVAREIASGKRPTIAADASTVSRLQALGTQDPRSLAFRTAYDKARPTAPAPKGYHWELDFNSGQWYAAKTSSLGLKELGLSIGLPIAAFGAASLLVPATAIGSAGTTAGTFGTAAMTGATGAGAAAVGGTAAATAGKLLATGGKISTPAKVASALGPAAVKTGASTIGKKTLTDVIGKLLPRAPSASPASTEPVVSASGGPGGGFPVGGSGPLFTTSTGGEIYQGPPPAAADSFLGGIPPVALLAVAGLAAILLTQKRGRR